MTGNYSKLRALHSLSIMTLFGAGAYLATSFAPNSHVSLSNENDSETGNRRVPYQQSNRGEIWGSEWRILPIPTTMVPTPTVVLTTQPTIPPKQETKVSVTIHRRTQSKTILQPSNQNNENALAKIRQCESGGDYSAVSRDGKYRGAYQFDVQTWQSVGGSGDPAAASAAEQDQRASILRSQRGSSPWPNCG